jgi:hypothetical protein
MTRDKTYQKQPRLVMCLLCTANALEAMRRLPPLKQQPINPVGVPANKFVAHMRDIHPITARPKLSLLKRVAQYLKSPV